MVDAAADGGTGSWLAGFADSARRWEPVIDAWVDRPGAVPPYPRNRAAKLSGVPFAVKDIIDVAGFPTRFGSAAFADASPAKLDATVVAALRRAGAVPVGKTRTTEFAFIDPTVTRNPYDPARSPGGSSSGSGAVVGAGIVPFALGTQTAGSLCRPATYCGAASYKPGYGVLPRGGVAPLSPRFDTVGVIAHGADWLETVFGVLADAFDIAPEPASRPERLRMGLLSVPEQVPEQAAVRSMANAVDRFRAAGHDVTEIATPISFSCVIDQHRTIMLAEAARHLIPPVGSRRNLLQPKLAAGLREGDEIPARAYNEAIRWVENARARFWNDLAGYDLLLAYPVPGAAPHGIATTGDQSYLTPWTALYGPLVSLPSGCDENGMPLGILLAAAPGRDAFLVRTACALAQHLPEVPLPRLPAA